MSSLSPSPSASLSPSPSPSSPTPSSSPWIVHKFGGTSLAAAACYRNAVSILFNELEHAEKINDIYRVGLVVSAMGEVKPNSDVARLVQAANPNANIQKIEKVTSMLIRCTELASRRDSSYLDLLKTLRTRHDDVIEELIIAPNDITIPDSLRTIITSTRQRLATQLDTDFADLSYILRSVWLSKTFDEKDHNWWFGYGELWSARLMHAYITIATAIRTLTHPTSTPLTTTCCDAREIVILSPGKDTIPDYTQSETLLHKWLSSSLDNASARIVVITGYIASSSQGNPTTLGRDGSDYSASIFAALLKARDVTIWTDVDGVYSANPTQVRDAVILDELSYDEASELAYFGAKVLHPKTMTPVIVHEIPIWIRNTFNAYASKGTCIRSSRLIAAGKERQKQQDREKGQKPVVTYGVKGFSEISNLTLITVEGTGMIGVPGVASRLFTALRNASCSVVLITQAGSEHSISFALPMAQGDIGLAIVRREFRDELQSGEITTVEKSEACACLAVVGDDMRNTRGVAGRMFSALADAGVNIHAIAQGSSERNISAIIAQHDVRTAICAVHTAFVSDTVHADYSPILTGKQRTESTTSQPNVSYSSTLPPVDVGKSIVKSTSHPHLYEDTVTLYVGIILSNLDGNHLRRLLSHLATAYTSHKISIQVIGLADTRDGTMLLGKHTSEHQAISSPRIIGRADAPQPPRTGTHHLDLDKFGAYITSHVNKKKHVYGVIMDLSDSESAWRMYGTWAKAGLRIVAQERPTTSPLTPLSSIPILHTLQSILSHGDHVTRIEAVLPSALTFALQHGDYYPRGWRHLSKSGSQIARVLVALSWQLGYNVSISDVVITPTPFTAGQSDDTIAAELRRLTAEARHQNSVVRYVASLTLTEQQPRLEISIRTIPSWHVLSHVQGSSSLISIYTQQYHHDPIILQGPVKEPFEMTLLTESEQVTAQIGMHEPSQVDATVHAIQVEHAIAQVDAIVRELTL